MFTLTACGRRPQLTSGRFVCNIRGSQPRDVSASVTASADRAQRKPCIKALSTQAVRRRPARGTVSCQAGSPPGSGSPPLSSGGGQGGFGEDDSGPSSWPLAMATFVFALLIAVGGIMGYRKKGSSASLISSGTFALILLMAGLFMQNPGQAVTGIRIATGTSMLLGGYMAYSFSRSKKAFPHGVFAGLSLTFCVGYASQLL